MNITKILICDGCGSTDLNMQGSIEWNSKEGKFEFSGSVTDSFCNVCDDVVSTDYKVELFPRKCDITNVGMKEGWHVGGDYAATEEACLKLIKEKWDCDNLEQAAACDDCIDCKRGFYRSCQGNDEFYYTDWHDEYYTLNNSQDSQDIDDVVSCQKGEAYDSAGNEYNFINNQWVMA